MVPAADQDDICCAASVTKIPTDQSCVQFAQQRKDHFDPFISDGRLPILELSPLHVFEDALEDAHPNMASFVLLLHQLGHGGHLLKRAVPHDLQISSQYPRKLHEHPLLNIAVLQHIEDLMADEAQCLLALRVR